MFLRLSKSKNAVLLMPGDGRVYVTSVKWLRMLIDGKASGDMIACTELSKAKDSTGSLVKGEVPKVDGFGVFQ